MKSEQKRLGQWMRWSALMGGATLVLVGCADANSGDADPDYPTESVELSVPWDAGGSTDLIAREIAREVENVADISVPTVNRPGGSGLNGVREVFNSSPDGYTQAVVSKSQYSISPIFEDEGNYLEFDEGEMVAGLTIEQYAIVVNSDSDIESLEDLQNQDGTVSYSHSGVGTGTHFSLEVLMNEMNLDGNGIPFDGSSPSITALLGGQVDVSAGNIAEVMTHIDSGDLRPIATMSEDRSEFLPDVPTAQEQGYDVSLDQRRALAVPNETPQEHIDRFHDLVREAEESESYSEFLKDNYIELWPADADETLDHFKQERTTIEETVDELGGIGE